MAARSAPAVAGPSHPARSRPVRTALLSATLLVLGVLAVLPGTARADTTGRGPDGQRLTVSSTTGLDPAGETVTVSGSGYHTDKGIYVAFCLDNGAGAPASPCGGGIDTSGSSGASHWISSSPPSYGEGLAVPYGTGGTFRVQLKVSAMIGSDVDCTVRRCVVATRNDHSRAADRSQDVRVPVTFAKAAPDPVKTTGGGTTTTRTGPPSTTAATRAGGAAGTPSPGGGDAVSPDPVTPSPDTARSADPAATGQTMEVSRVSDSTTSGQWWAGSTLLFGAALVILVAWRIRARRRERP